MSAPLIKIKDLKVFFASEGVRIPAVRGISFQVDAGETLCLVGESGCGKSATALAIMGLIPHAGGRVEGEIIFNGQDLLKLPERELQKIRGNQISLVFQEPMTSLNPLFSIGYQMTETLRLHLGLSKPEAKARAVELLKMVDIPAPEKRLADYPQKLSGGMRQRVMIAMAIGGSPKLLIADEPTTALDVTVQAQILAILAEMRQRLGLSLLLITHDMGIVAEVGQRVAVMYAGKIVELTSVAEIFAQPLHPYTQGLLSSLPAKNQTAKRLTSIPGTVPQPQDFPSACAFAPRCPLKKEICREIDSELKEITPRHFVSCHRTSYPGISG